MPCNLNFNQCNLGPSYPRPVNTCNLILRNLLSSSTNNVVNPVVIPSWSFFNFVTTQTVGAGENVVFNLISGSGTNIIPGADGEISLSSGTYQLSFSVNGVIASNNVLSVGLFQNGTFIPASESIITGVAGTNVTLANNAIITVPSGGATITLKNINSVSESFSSGNLTIVKL